MKKKAVIAIVISVVSTAIFSVVFGTKYVNSLKSGFAADGYIMMQSQETGNKRIDFTAGTVYKDKYPDSIEFTDANGNSVTVPRENFIHYSDGSIGALKDTPAEDDSSDADIEDGSPAETAGKQEDADEAGGTDREDSTDGASGAEGTGGADGASGAGGADGASGASGAEGTGGTNGSDGSDGADSQNKQTLAEIELQKQQENTYFMAYSAEDGTYRLYRLSDYMNTSINKVMSEEEKIEELEKSGFDIALFSGLLADVTGRSRTGAVAMYSTIAAIMLLMIITVINRRYNDRKRKQTRM